MSNSQEVALFGDKSSMPAHLQQEETSLGNENAGGDAQAVPMLKLLQALSPEVQSLEGARPGLLLNNVTKELMQSTYCINLYFERYFTVWRDRKKGGGKFGEFATEAEALAHIGGLDGDAADYHAQETHKHYLLLLDAQGDPAGPAVLYMKATQLTPSRNWNTSINLHGQGKSRFATVWTLGSEKQKNARNETYDNFTVAFAGFAPEGLYHEAKQTYLSLVGDRAAAA
jgi:hypothetical protein